MDTIYFEKHKDKRYSFVKFHNVSTDYASPHNHNCYECMIVANGKFSHILNGEERILEKCDCCLIRPEDVHCFRSLTKDNSHYMIMIKKEEFERFLDFCSAFLKKDVIAAPSCYFSISESRIKKIVSLLNTIREEDAGNDDNPIYVNMLLFNLIEPIIKVNPSTATPRHPKWFEDLLFAINSLENADWTVSDIVKYSHYSHTHLEKVFKEEMGMSLVQYRIKVNMIHARDFLINTDKSIIEISTLIGYSSLSHFHRVFKSIYGLTPKEYRTKYREIDA